MLSLDSVISTFSPPIVAKIEELQKDGFPFLRKLQSFTESDMIDFSKSASLYDYMVQTIMNNTEDTPVQVNLFPLTSRSCRMLPPLFSIVLGAVVMMSSAFLFALLLTFSTVI